jgi:hypothetical protein
MADLLPAGDRRRLQLGATNHARNHNLRLADLSRGVAEGTINPRSLDPLKPRQDR